MTFLEATSGKPGQRILPLVYCGGDVRYFIAIGFPGFNSPANNRSGYASPEGALAASLRYQQHQIAQVLDQMSRYEPEHEGGG